MIERIIEKDHIRLQSLEMFTGKHGDFLWTGEDNETLHQQCIANTIVFINGDSDNRVWSKAPEGTAGANTALLTKAIKSAIEAANLPVVESQLSQLGDSSDGD